MAAFALGTTPGLLGVGWAGLLFGRGWLRVSAMAAPVLLLIGATMLLVMLRFRLNQRHSDSLHLIGMEKHGPGGH